MGKSTYNINEEQLKQHFSAYRVDFNEQHWFDFEKKLNEAKIQPSISLGKINKAWLIVPLVAGALGASGFYFYNNPFHTENAIPVAATTIIPETKPVVKAIVPKPVPPAPVTAIQQPIEASDSLQKTAKNETSDSGKVSADKKENNIEVAAHREAGDTSTLKENHAELIINHKDSSEHHPEAVHKKKKKKKKRGANESIESIHSRSLVPNSSDDDVVVPVNN